MVKSVEEDEGGAEVVLATFSILYRDSKIELGYPICNLNVCVREFVLIISTIRRIHCKNGL